MRAIWFVVCMLAWPILPVLAQETLSSPSPIETRGELRLRLDTRITNTKGPAAAANASVVGSVPMAPEQVGPQLNLHMKSKWLIADATLQSSHATAATSSWHQATLNELYLPLDLGNWQASAGRQIVSWDVGYGYRPNDLVQREERLQELLPPFLQGRPLVQLEHYGDDQSISTVWVNPQRLHAHLNDDLSNIGDENAFALRAYQRNGGADQYLFARWGKHTHAGLGGAFSWVASDSVELHGSLHLSQHQFGWTLPNPVDGQLLNANPWQRSLLGKTQQVLVGLGWTGEQKQSLLLEGWYDGAATSDAEWDAWNARNASLGALAGHVPVAALAGNLAWQTVPTATQNIRRETVFLRAAWETGNWKFSLDTIWTPADHGMILTPLMQWQGERTRIYFAARYYGGAIDSIYRQLPDRAVATLAVAYLF